MANLIKLSSYEPGLGIAGSDIIFGSGTPGNLSAPQGSLYVNTTASTTTTRLFINTNGTTGWTYFTTNA